MKSLELFKQCGEPIVVIDDDGEEVRMVPYKSVDIPGPEEELKI